MKYTKIKSDEQYDEYCELHEKLTYDNYESNLEEIELLEILIDEYEKRTIETPEGMNPVEIISYLLQENSVTKSQLAKELKVSRQLITDILNYRRNISKTMVNKLSDRFKLKPTAFSKPYELKNAKPKNVRQTV
ncbi:MAG: helix-turn-helix domain-containing protein [Saprospiraceae bacterium]|nr:helix-turn-helix domain-containing protein [Saprospiraceae bacterium]